MSTRIFNLGLRAAFLLLFPVCVLSASERRETPLVRAVKRAAPAVVNIHTEKTAQDRDGGLGGPGRKITGMGTGIVIDEQGYIVTNQHVIADVDTLRVTLLDHGTFDALVVSYDRKHDLAVIKINPTRPLEVAPLGTSSDLMLGETVIAVGNAFGYEHTVTAGIISALGRDVEVNEKQAYRNLIQTDASINPGNSGGPLLNLDGQVVGINVAIRAGAQRIGFAIPIDDARLLVAKLINTRRLNDTYHGLVGRDVKSAEKMELVINATESDSPAARAGLQPGDIVLQADRVSVKDQADFERALLGRGPGDKVAVTIRRDGQEQSLPLELVKANGRGPTTPAQMVARANNLDEFSERVWQTIGIRLSKMPEQQVVALQTRYRGGMQVLEVRADSPAARNGIQQGDILVGLHQWETTKQDDVTYVLGHNDFATFNPLKFFVLRGRQPLFGYLQLPSTGR